ncbi:motility associated factor glycosyltransferase family protein [Wukongibacter sp. M2B1]|uniref:motility associated factor glycosyltransferase family protein n=1 Tax=Wukongibacter sp. M2B1 TaxID=3088895 RepID=UPI003D7B0824
MNSEIYNKNIQSLETRYPDYIKKESYEKENDLQINVMKARDGNKAMVIYHDQRNIYINSKYRPLEEAQKWTQGLNIKENSVIVVFGFGIGYRIKEIVNIMTSNNILVIIEPRQQIMCEIIKHIDITSVIENPNVYLHIGDKEIEYKRLFQSVINWRNINNTVFQYMPNYSKLFPKECKNYMKVLKETIYVEKCSYNTIHHFSERWQENIFRNIPHILKSSNVKNLFNKFDHKPAIIVSAGPSLNKNVELLKKVKGKAVIICVGTALRALLKKNIEPDFVISIDGGEPNYSHFKDIDCSNIPLVYSPLLYPEILNKHRGQKILFRSEEIYLGNSFNKYINDIGIVKNSGTVAFAALDFAVQMGCNPAIFVGQDLAYTNGKTHSKGTIYEDAAISKKEEKKLIEVDSIDGGKVLTNQVLYSFLCLFQDEIGNDTSERLYIDATEGGAKIKGTEVMTFRKAIDEYCEEYIGVTDIIKETIRNKKNLSNEDLYQFVNEFKYIENELQSIKSKCKEGEKLSSKLVKIYKGKSMYDSKQINSILSKLHKIDNHLKKKKENFESVKYIIEPLMTKVVNDEDFDKYKKESPSEREEAIQISKRSKLFYGKIEEKLEFILPILRECIEKMKKINT